MATHLWLITAKTNLHVGNENTAGTGIIDKAVQRDALTGLPCINSSSLKGAIKEWCTALPPDKMSAEVRKIIFGSDKGGSPTESQKGRARFFDAKLLYIPKQCDDVPYRLATHKILVDEIIARAEMLGLGVEEDLLKENVSASAPKPKFTVLEEYKDFYTLCDDEHLPVIARNALENGLSENLWYEQVIPAETVFCAMIDDMDGDPLMCLDGQYVQIGANATIGYGLCKFTNVKVI